MKNVQFATREALTNRTPLWAKNMFRITFIITSAAMIFIAGTQVIPESIKFEAMLILKTIDALVLGFSKMFGVTNEEINFKTQ